MGATLEKTELSNLVRMGRAEWVSLVPANGKKWSRLSKQLFLAVSDKEAAALLGLIQESEALYRHYENQKHYFSNILLIFSAGLSLAPFQYQFSTLVTGLLISFSAAFIFIIAYFGRIFLVHLRERMKRMQFRSEMLRCKLFGAGAEEFEIWVSPARDGKTRPRIKIQVDYVVMPVEQIIKIADQRAKASIEEENYNEKHEPLRSRLTALNEKRGAIWGLLPQVAKLYAIIYFFLGLAIAFQPQVSKKTQNANLAYWSESISAN